MLDQLSSIAVHVQRDEARALTRIYSESGSAFYWTEGARPTEQAGRLIETLRNADAYGLGPSDYRDLVSSAESAETTLRSAGESGRARFDLLLTTAAIRFVSHLHLGRVTSLSAGFALPARPELDVLAVVQSLATSKDLTATLATYEPLSPSYQRLKEALNRYRALAKDADLNNLSPLPTPILEVGDRYRDAARLRRLLNALGDAAFGTSDLPDEYDPTLADAIAKFQQRHGLTADGRIGAKTFAALTMSLDRRVRQIELSLERWRWAPHLELPLVVINIPQFMLFALPYQNAGSPQPPIEMPVVVGRSGDRTPIFMSEIESVVFNPYWNVPRSILMKELLPHLRRDADYLQRHQMEIVAGEGDDAKVMEQTPETLDLLASGRLRLRQRPGPLNALGLIKFVLPNPYNVYLHGTPEIQLFSREQRSFSHGCIRVSDPPALAEYVLRNAAEEWSRDRVEQAMFGSETMTVHLQNKIPILVFYTTVVATASRGVLFFDDVYGHDRKLETLLGLEPVR